MPSCFTITRKEGDGFYDCITHTGYSNLCSTDTDEYFINDEEGYVEYKVRDTQYITYSFTDTYKFSEMVFKYCFCENKIYEEKEDL